MDVLKKLFPYSFGIKDTNNFIVKIIVYVVASIVLGAVIALAGLLVGWIPVVGAIIGWALGLISSLCGLYCLAGLVILILVFCKVIK